MPIFLSATPYSVSYEIALRTLANCIVTIDEWNEQQRDLLTRKKCLTSAPLATNGFTLVCPLLRLLLHKLFFDGVVVAHLAAVGKNDKKVTTSIRQLTGIRLHRILSKLHQLFVKQHSIYVTMTCHHQAFCSWLLWLLARGGTLIFRRNVEF